MTRHPDLIRLNRVLNAAGLLSVAGVLAAVWFFGLRSARRDSEQLAGRQAQLQRFLETETAAELSAAVRSAGNEYRNEPGAHQRTRFVRKPHSVSGPAEGNAAHEPRVAARTRRRRRGPQRVQH
jgi:hypothetical protein